MNKIYKISLRAVRVMVLLFIAVYLYYVITYPKVGQAKIITINSTPEMVARGEYLAHHVAVCMDCHSTRDWGYFSGPLKDGTLGKG